MGDVLTHRWKDAPAGNPAYFWVLFTDSARRGELLRDGWRSIGGA